MGTKIRGKAASENKQRGAERKAPKDCKRFFASTRLWPALRVAAQQPALRAAPALRAGVAAVPHAADGAQGRQHAEEDARDRLPLLRRHQPRHVVEDVAEPSFKKRAFSIIGIHSFAAQSYLQNALHVSQGANSDFSQAGLPDQEEDPREADGDERPREALREPAPIHAVGLHGWSHAGEAAKVSLRKATNNACTRTSTKM